MRNWISLIESVEQVSEGRSIKLSNGRRIIEAPGRSDIVAMLANSRMLRGEIIDNGDGPKLYVWNGRLLSHYNAIIELKDLNGGQWHKAHISLKIGIDAEAIKEDRYWRNTDPTDCGGYFVAFARPQPYSYQFDLTASPYFSRLFPSAVIPDIN